MRLVRVVMALVFGLGLASPEARQCPRHNHADSAASHQSHTRHDSPTKHCTCPQVCCPANPGASLRPATISWTLPADVHMYRYTVAAPASVRRAPVRHLLPLAQAPPQIA